MPTTETLLAFFSYAFVLAIIPGPDNLFVVTLSTLQGVKTGLWVVLGLCTGLVIHTLAVAFGIGAIVTALPIAFTILKWLGAGYLAYLAWGAWRSTCTSTQTNHTATPSQPTPPTLSALHAWRRGFIMNLSNPKVLMFFLALFPDFMHPQQGSIISQSIVLGLCFILASAITFSGFALLAGSIGQKLQQSTSAQNWLNRLAAVLFVALAVQLVLPN